MGFFLDRFHFRIYFCNYRLPDHYFMQINISIHHHLKVLKIACGHYLIVDFTDVSYVLVKNKIIMVHGEIYCKRNRFLTLTDCDYYSDCEQRQRLRAYQNE